MKGEIECMTTQSCRFSVWKGSFSKISYPILMDIKTAKKFNMLSVKTIAYVSKINPPKVFIGGYYTPIFRREMGIKLIEKESCE